MTRFRIWVNPESRDPPACTLTRKSISDSVPAWRAPSHSGRGFTPSAYADDEKEENEGMLKWKWGDKSKRSK
jgi:hypothetical protein